MPFGLAASVILLWTSRFCVVNSQPPVKSGVFKGLTIQTGDVLLAVDCSTYVASDKFQSLITVNIPRFLEKLPISKDQFRIAVAGLCQYETDKSDPTRKIPGLLLNLTSGTSIDAVKMALASMKQFEALGNTWGQAFHFAQKAVFQKKYTGKGLFKKILIIVDSKGKSPFFPCHCWGYKDYKDKLPYLPEYLNSYPDATLVALKWTNPRYSYDQMMGCAVSGETHKHFAEANGENVLKHITCQNAKKMVTKCQPVGDLCMRWILYSAPENIHKDDDKVGCPIVKTIGTLRDCPSMCVKEDDHCSSNATGRCRANAPKPRCDLPSCIKDTCPGNVPPGTCRNLVALRTCNLSGICEIGPIPECTAIAYAIKVNGKYFIKRKASTNNVIDSSAKDICENVLVVQKCFKWWKMLEERFGVFNPCASMRPGFCAKGQMEKVCHRIPVHGIEPMCKKHCGYTLSSCLLFIDAWRALYNSSDDPCPGYLPSGCRSPADYNLNCGRKRPSYCHGKWDEPDCAQKQSKTNCLRWLGRESRAMNHPAGCLTWLRKQCRGWRVPTVCAISGAMSCETNVPKEHLCAEPLYRERCMDQKAKTYNIRSVMYCNGPQPQKETAKHSSCYGLVYGSAEKVRKMCRFIGAIEKCFTWALRFVTRPCPVMPDQCTHDSKNPYCIMVRSTLNDKYDQQCEKICKDDFEVKDACKAMRLYWINFPKSENKKWPCTKVISTSSQNKGGDRLASHCILPSDVPQLDAIKLSVCRNKLMDWFEKTCSRLNRNRLSLNDCSKNELNEKTENCPHRLFMTDIADARCQSFIVVLNCQGSSKSTYTQMCGLRHSVKCVARVNTEIKEELCSWPSFQYNCLFKGANTEQLCVSPKQNKPPPTVRCYTLLYMRNDNPVKMNSCWDEDTVRTCIDWLITETAAGETDSICSKDIKPAACLEPMQPEWCFKMRPKKYHDCLYKCSNMHNWKECLDTSRDKSTGFFSPIDLCTHVNPPECSKPNASPNCFQKAPEKCADLFQKARTLGNKQEVQNLCKDESIHEIQDGTCIGWLLATGKGSSSFPCTGSTRHKRSLFSDPDPCDMACVMNHIKAGCETFHKPNELCGDPVYQKACLADTSDQKNKKAKDWCMKASGAKRPPPTPECYSYYFKAVQARVAVTEMCERTNVLINCLPWFDRSVKDICRGGPSMCMIESESPLCKAFDNTPLSTDKACELLCMSWPGDKLLDEACQVLIRMEALKTGRKPGDGHMMMGPCKPKHVPKTCKEHPFTPRCFKAINATSSCAQHFLPDNMGICTDITVLVKYLDCYDWWQKMGLPSDPCNGDVPDECNDPSPERKEDCGRLASATCTKKIRHTCEDPRYRLRCPDACPDSILPSICDVYRKAPVKERQEMCRNDTIMAACAKVIQDTAVKCLNGAMPLQCRHGENRPSYCRYLSELETKNTWLIPVIVLILVVLVIVVIVVIAVIRHREKREQAKANAAAAAKRRMIPKHAQAPASRKSPPRRGHRPTPDEKAHGAKPKRAVKPQPPKTKGRDAQASAGAAKGGVSRAFDLSLTDFESSLQDPPKKKHYTSGLKRKVVRK